MTMLIKFPVRLADLIPDFLHTPYFNFLLSFFFFFLIVNTPNTASLPTHALTYRPEWTDFRISGILVFD